MSTISPQWRSTHVDRREAVIRRLAATTDVLSRVDAALAGTAAQAADLADAGQGGGFAYPDVPAGHVPLDPDGSLRAAVHAMVGVSQRIPGFDVRVTGGTGHGWAVRVRQTPHGIVTQLVYAPEAEAGGRVIQISG